MKLIEALNKTPFSNLPKEVKPMLSTLVKEPFTNPNWLFEIKWDGYRAISQIENGKVEIYSRNNISFNKRFPEVAEALTVVNEDIVFDGEIVVVDETGLPNFELIQTYQTKKEGTPIYYLFDILHFRGHDLTSLPLLTRKKILATVIKKYPSFYLRESEFVKKIGEEFFVEAKRLNLEGIVAKRIDSIYRPGLRSKDWLKIKTHLEQEAVIGGFTKPRGGRVGFGSLILGVYDNGSLIHIGNAGGGFKDRELAELHKKLKKIEVPISPFEDYKENSENHYVKPILVGEVKFAQWTKDGVMRQPIFLGLRDDKNPKEVRREIPKEGYET